jgi:hypothetical protein
MIALLTHQMYRFEETLELVSLQTVGLEWDLIVGEFAKNKLRSDPFLPGSPGDQ